MAQSLKQQTTSYPISQDLTIPDSGYIYIGDRNTDGSWRLLKVGSEMVFEQRVLGVWTKKSALGGS